MTKCSGGPPGHNWRFSKDRNGSPRASASSCPLRVCPAERTQNPCSLMKPPPSAGVPHTAGRRTTHGYYKEQAGQHGNHVKDDHPCAVSSAGGFATDSPKIR
jgi:hypothetical protein